ncbi:Ig-like domain-containing protein [Nocardioides sp. TF02-7]|uniref:Ig-like domain-containing protein n=1 Tax=Nocardioides sp. TF02-7 TaxID=2917724 RepID=UPI001F053612|nr:Ig-like domain-containing protein [Nocardioides sp. TF02-7]UMG93583.1 hypothetical protein MF408_05170 [Nocardioides sp. TF02-7]
MLTADIPAASGDVSDLKALAMGADVNFFDPRNPGALSEERTYDPASTSQDFEIVLVDADGNEGVVNAGDERWGNALHMSTGTQTSRTHIVLDQVRVPLTEFEAQGVDLTSLDTLELRFGGEGLPQSGSIQLADVRFQEADVAEPLVLSDGTDPDQGAGWGPPATGPDPAEVLASYDNTPGAARLVDTVGHEDSGSAWVVDDDRAECPDAGFTSIQDAVDHAAPWDTIVVCAGVYDERSEPVFGPGNPVATGALNGLTITKPLTIKGAGADLVTIRPDQSLDSLAGLEPYLRDGGGNVITVSRQSLGSTDTNEMFVDISGVTVTSGSTYAEAGIAFFGAAGRVSDSVVGPLATATSEEELADAPHGWGIVQTGVIQGSGPGTVETEVTVSGSLVTGYQSGGILFDGAKGPDGAPANVERTGIRQHGYVVDTVVRGRPGRVVPQTGIHYASGVDGFVRGSRVTGNYFRPDPAQSFGILLTDAGTEDGGLLAEGSVVTGNGWAAYNANADGTAVREGAPFTVRGSYLGTGNPVVGGPADPSEGLEAVSGPDSGAAATVVTPQRQSAPIPGVPTGPGSMTDEAPVAALVDPAGGTEVLVGETLSPLVLGRDDHAVRSATLLVDGVEMATDDSAPYSFAWTPGAAEAGEDVTLEAVVTDSAGQTTTAPALTVTVTEETVSPRVKVAKVVKRKGKGTATLVVAVNTPGRVTLTGGKVVRTSTTATAPGRVRLTVKAKPAFRKVLRRKGRLPVAVRVTLAATSGDAATARRSVVLVKK